MNILGVQILAIFFAIFMLYVTFLHFKRREINGKETLFWVILWIGFIIITLFPNILQGISKKLFFTRVMDFLMVLAFMILAFIGFNNHILVKKIRKDIDKIIRNKTLKNLKKNK